MNQISITKRVAKNFSWLVVGDVLSRGLNFFTIIYLARVLGASAFGLFNFAQAILIYGLLLVDSGLSLLGTREIAKTKEHAGALTLNIIAVRSILSLILFALSMLVIWLVPATTDLKLLFVLTFIFVFSRAINVDWAFMGLEKMEFIAYSKILTSACFFFLVVWLVKGSNDLLTVPLIYAISGVGISFLFLLLIFRLFTPFRLTHLKPSRWWDYLYESIPLGAVSIVTVMYHNMDTIMLGLMNQTAAVGLYNASYKLFYVVAGFIGLWQFASLSVVTGYFKDSKAKALDFLDKYLRLTLLAVIPVITLITVFAGQIIYLAYGAEYLPGVSALQVLIWGNLPLALSGVFGVLILFPIGKSKEFFYGASVGAIANLLLNLVLIPRYGYFGSSVATLLSECLVAFAMYALVRKEYPVPIIKNAWIPVLASIASVLPLCWFTGGVFSVVLGSLVFCLIYFAVIYLFGEWKLIEKFLLETVRKNQP
jgi:O-antigen/teichoic acid export membrane protein